MPVLQLLSLLEVLFRPSSASAQSSTPAYLDNSYEVIAQAARYSVKYHTPYIALFDWGHFVLAVMKKSYRL